MILRVVWVLCFCGAGLAAFFWWKIDYKMSPLNKVVVLQAGNPITESFLPTMEDNIGYQVTLAFEQTPTFPLNCNDLRMLDIRWVVSEDQAVNSWNRLSETSKAQEFFCGNYENVTFARFPSSHLKPHVKHYLHLITGNKKQFQVRASVSLEGGITLHYLFMDKAALEILGGLALLVGFLCLLTDFCVTLFKWRNES